MGGMQVRFPKADLWHKINMALGWLVWTGWDEEDTHSAAAAGSAVLVTKLWAELTLIQIKLLL